MEAEYQRQPDSNKRLAIAKQMVPMYQRMMLNPIQPDQITTQISKAKNLVQDFPQLDSPQFQIAINHSQFLRTEDAFFQWWQTGAEGKDSQNIRTALESIAQQLQQLRRILLENRKDLVTAIPLGNQSENTTNQTKLRRVTSQLAHVDFLDGWIDYFSAMLFRTPDEKLLAFAHQHFYDALQIEQTNSIESIDSKWLDFEGLFGKRTLLGLALVYSAQRKPFATQFCFEEIKKMDKRFHSMLWRINAIAFARNWNAIEATLSQIDLSAISDNERRRFFNALVQAGIVAEAMSQSADTLLQAKQIQRRGFTGLLRLFDFETISKLTNKTNFQFSDTVTEDLWISGILLLKQSGSDSGSDSKLLEQAAEKFRQARKSAGKQTDATDILRIQYLLAVTEFRNRNAQTALELLTPAIVDNDDDLLAESSQWLKSNILLQQSKQNPQMIAAALASLNKLGSRFPNSKFAGRIRFERLLLESKLLPPQQANKILSNAKNDTSYYPEIQFELANNQFQIWQAAFRNQSENETQLFQDLTTSTTNIIANPDANGQRQAAALFLQIEANLKREVDSRKTQALVEQCEQLLKKLKIPNRDLEDDLNFYVLRLAQQREDLSAADQIADRIASESTKSRHRISALVYLAERSRPRNVPVKQQIEIYQRLLNELSGNSQTQSAAIRADQNARVAAVNLVELLIMDQQFNRALPINNLLLNVDGKRREFVVNAANIASGLDQKQEALELWRKTASGTPVGDPLWLEAKYSIAKLHATDNAILSRQIIEQTMAISENLPAPWEKRFSDLFSQIESE